MMGRAFCIVVTVFDVEVGGKSHRDLNSVEGGPRWVIGQRLTK